MDDKPTIWTFKDLGYDGYYLVGDKGNEHPLEETKFVEYSAYEALKHKLSKAEMIISCAEELYRKAQAEIESLKAGPPTESGNKNGK